MIDFRYHLVSLVAVFIALAVGIALGAGPLREGLSSTLESEVGQLREERTALRDEIDFANERAESREQAFGRLAGRALDGTLEEVRVGVVVLPGADRNTLERLESQLDRAGAQIVLSADVLDAWVDPAPDQEMLDRLGDSLEVPLPRAGTEPTAATVLAAVLAGADQPGQLGAWITAGTELDDVGLVDFTWRGGTSDEFTDRRPPDAVVVVSGGLDAEAVQEPEGEQALDVRVDLVDALARLEVPLVVTGQGTEERPTEEVDLLDPLVAAVRADRGLADAVSTVDNLEHITGQVAASLALAWQLEGESGHYGLGDLAEAAIPVPPPQRATGVGVTVPEDDDAPPEDAPPEDETPGDDTEGLVDPGADAQPGTDGGSAADPAASTAAP